MLMVWHTRFSFSRSASDLENDRLRKQIDDAAVLVDLILEGGRPAEPAYYMWHKHLPALLVAGMLSSMEWTFHRGFSDKVFWKFSRLHDAHKGQPGWAYVPPPWFRDPDVCRSHRSHLMAQEPDHYDAELWPGTPERLPLVWPVVADDPAVVELRVAKTDLALIKSRKLVVPASIRERVVNL